jgi:tRNA(adenine34) deaminase
MFPPGTLPGPPDPLDALWMARAFEMALLAGARGEVPVGAVVTQRGQLVAEGHNLTVTERDPTAHAEVVVLREAARRIDDWRLLECTLYVTLEPCAMCAGASVLSRIPRLVFGATDPKAGMVGSLGNLAQDSRLNHSIQVTGGVSAEASGTLLKEFFRARRG